MYLCPPDPKSLGVIASYSSATEPQQDAALDLLEEHASQIDTARVNTQTFSKLSQFSVNTPGHIVCIKKDRIWK